jgi:glycosyltransferase involved in cell wall biosynthesis
LNAQPFIPPLLRAYAQIVDSHPAALLIVGGICRGEDRKIFDELKSSIPHAKIVVTGYVSNHDLPSYYLLMDVIVHPSLRDGLPNVLLEAMACGKPVIATPVGGVIDVLDDCRNGRIVPIADVHSLSTVIQEVLSDKIMQAYLGSAARRIIRDRYTFQNELDGNLIVYRKLGIKV